MGSKIALLPTYERPREKAYRYGFDTLSDTEVLAIIISSGTKGISALDLSNIVLSNFGGLYNTINKSFSDFLKFKGIKKATAAKLCAIFEIAKRYNSLRIMNLENQKGISSEFLYQKYVISCANLNQEKLVLIVTNSRKQIILERTLFIGDDANVILSIRDIIKMVLTSGGRNFYIIHNHPSGNIMPSKEDVEFTKSLIKESRKMGIRLLDHLIIGETGYYSFLKNDIKEETNAKNY